MKPEDWIDAKEKPLPDGIPCLILTASDHFQVVQKTANTWYEIEKWMPIVPPPKPDPFEAWWSQSTLSTREFTAIRVWCKEAWDAAIKSKEHGE